MTTDSRITIRRADQEDEPAIIALASAALGWDPDRPNELLFRWKHRENPFGPSAMWVAHLDGEMVGFRAFLRWGFRMPDGELVPAVRAVDTATAPGHQGRGIFTRLTSRALEELAGEGVGFIFNTPNDRSIGGYLKLGWRIAGRLPISVRPRFARLASLARARAPAERWSLPCDIGAPAATVFAQDAAIGAAELARRPDRVATAVDASFLRWRYGLPELNYRVIPAPGSLAAGFVAFRQRSRGPAVETAICELALPRERSARRHARRNLLRSLGAAAGDYALWAGSAESTRGFLPLPRLGPVVVVRDLSRRAPRLDDLDLRLGDIELL